MERTAAAVGAPVEHRFGGAHALDLGILRKTFPGRHIGGAPEYWYAIRGGSQAANGPRSLLRCFLSANSLVALADKLSLQAYLDQLDDPELADVWDRVALPYVGKQVAL